MLLLLPTCKSLLATCQQHIVVRISQKRAVDARKALLCFQRNKLGIHAEKHDHGHPTSLFMQMCKDDESGARAAAGHCLEGAKVKCNIVLVKFALYPNLSETC